MNITANIGISQSICPHATKQTLQHKSPSGPAKRSVTLTARKNVLPDPSRAHGTSIDVMTTLANIWARQHHQRDHGTGGKFQISIANASSFAAVKAQFRESVLVYHGPSVKRRKIGLAGRPRNAPQATHTRHGRETPPKTPYRASGARI